MGDAFDGSRRTQKMAEDRRQHLRGRVEISMRNHRRKTSTVTVIEAVGDWQCYLDAPGRRRSATRCASPFSLAKGSAARSCPRAPAVLGGCASIAPREELATGVNRRAGRGTVALTASEELAVVRRAHPRRPLAEPCLAQQRAAMCRVDEATGLGSRRTRQVPHVGAVRRISLPVTMITGTRAHAADRAEAVTPSDARHPMLATPGPAPAGTAHGRQASPTVSTT